MQVESLSAKQILQTSNATCELILDEGWTTYPFPWCLPTLSFTLSDEEHHEKHWNQFESLKYEIYRLTAYLVSKWRNTLVNNPLRIYDANFLMCRLYRCRNPKKLQRKLHRTRTYRTRKLANNDKPQHTFVKQNLDPNRAPSHSVKSIDTNVSIWKMHLKKRPKGQQTDTWIICQTQRHALLENTGAIISINL